MVGFSGPVAGYGKVTVRRHSRGRTVSTVHTQIFGAGTELSANLKSAYCRTKQALSIHPNSRLPGQASIISKNPSYHSAPLLWILIGRKALNHF